MNIIKKIDNRDNNEKYNKIGMIIIINIMIK